MTQVEPIATNQPASELDALKLELFEDVIARYLQRHWLNDRRAHRAFEREVRITSRQFAQERTNQHAQLIAQTKTRLVALQESE